MRAHAHLVVERDADGRSVVRTLRSAAPLTLLPVRGRPVVHLVGSAAGPLGGDDLTLTVEVGPHARLTIAAPTHTSANSNADAQAPRLIDQNTGRTETAKNPSWGPERPKNHPIRSRVNEL